jgi:hypothetical protein
MANKIVLKKSSVTGRVPVVGDLDYGELALNYTDGKLYYKTSQNAIEAFSVDQLITITVNITLTTEWQDTGITATNLATGSYLVQLFANDSGAGGSNVNEYYTGSMSWYQAGTNSSNELPTDEIVLHRAGASGDGALYLRTYRTPAGFLKLQIYSNQANASSSNYVFKFRRMI